MGYSQARTEFPRSSFFKRSLLGPCVRVCGNPPKTGTPGSLMHLIASVAHRLHVERNLVSENETACSFTLACVGDLGPADVAKGLQ